MQQRDLVPPTRATWAARGFFGRGDRWYRLTMASLPNDVLIVEDDAIIALDLEELVLRLVVKSARTVSSVADALELIAKRAPNFALLDVNLHHENSFAIAEKLAILKIPFAFVTGYGSDGLPRAFSDRPRLPKPCSRRDLLLLLQRFGGASR
jgi:two-component SAPR family response regulator